MKGEYPYWGANGVVDYIDQWIFDEDLILLGEDGAPFFDSTKDVAFNITGKIWVNNHAHILRPKINRIHQEYLTYALNCVNYYLYINGSTRDKLTQSEMGNIVIWYPPIEEQRQIVLFLNRETSKIDTLIAKQEELIQLLQEKRQAVISRAVTKGLNPHAPMKDSGIEWLGQIPAHWETSYSKWLFTVRTERARPDDIQLSATQAYGVISQVEFMQREGRRVTQITQHLDKRRHVEIDDFVISMRSFQGGLERAWQTGCIRSSYVVLKPSPEIVVDFFTYLFKSYPYIQALRATSNFLRDGQDMNFNNFCLVDLPKIPKPEQRAIATFLDNETKKIDTLIEKSKQFIELLNERRTALISAAVTGKIDVRHPVEQGTPS